MSKESNSSSFQKFGLADTKTVTRWLSGSYGTNWMVAGFVVLHLVITGALASNSLQSIPGLNEQLKDVLTGAAVFLVVVVAGRNVKSRFTYSLIVNVLIWLTAALVGGISLLALSFVYAGKVIAGLVPVAMNGLVAVPLFFAGYTLLVASWIETKDSINSLFVHRLALIRVGRFVNEQILQIREQLYKQVITQIDSIVSELRLVSLGDDNDSNRKKASEKLLTQVDEVIRPLSWEISTSMSNTSTEDLIRSSYKGSSMMQFGSKMKRTNPLLRIREKVSPAQLVAPGINALIYTLFLIPVSLILFGPIALLASSATIYAVYLSLTVYTKITSSIKITTLSGLLLTTFVGIVVSFTFAITIVATTSSADYYIAALSSVVMSLSTFLICIFQIIEFHRMTTLNEISRVNKEIEIEISNGRKSERQLRKIMSRFVHGKVQTRLLALGLKLRNDGDLDALTLEQATLELEEVSKLIMRESLNETMDFEYELDQLIRGWSGVVTIVVSENIDFPAAFKSDLIATESTLEVLGEAISNAVKHAGSKRIELGFNFVEQDAVIVRVRNSFGEGRPRVIKPSFGSKTLDELAIDWSMEAKDGHFELMAKIKITQ